MADKTRFLLMSLLITGLCLMPLHTGMAQTTSITSRQPTTLEAVVNSAYRHYPAVRAAATDITRSESEIISARGAFDPRLEGRLGNRLQGYYDGDSREAGYYQSLPAMGAEIFAELSHSDGTFPRYQSQLLTADRGQARLGFALSLLRNRDIDQDRLTLAVRELEREVSQYELVAERVSVVQQAYVAYARWLVSAHLLEAYRQLLAFAEARDSALQRQVEAGDAAEILIVENRQAILQRRGLVIDAERQLEVAAQNLALYLRSDDGAMRVPVYDPALSLPVPSGFDDSSGLSGLVDRTLAINPEIRVLDLIQDQARLERSLAVNDTRPQLDLRAYTTRGFGSGPDSLLDTQQVVDLSFSIPLRNREARGRVAAMDARLDGLGHQLRLLREQTETELRNALVSLNARRELLATSREEVAVAEALVAAETRRFEAGLSDFFLLNVRENTLAQAQLRQRQAELDFQVALATFHGLSLDLGSLGIANSRAPGHTQ